MKWRARTLTLKGTYSGHYICSQGQCRPHQTTSMEVLERGEGFCSIIERVLQHQSQETQVTPAFFFRIPLAFPQSYHYWHLPQSSALTGWVSHLSELLRTCSSHQEPFTTPVHMGGKGLSKLLQEIRALLPRREKELCAHSWGLHFWSHFTFLLTSLQGLKSHSPSPNQILLSQFHPYLPLPPALNELG